MSLKEGKCSECGSTEVYTNKKNNPRGERGQLIVSSFKFMFIDTYICLNCGKFEEYVNESDFKDEKVREKIKKNWKKA